MLILPSMKTLAAHVMRGGLAGAIFVGCMFLCTDTRLARAQPPGLHAEPMPTWAQQKPARTLAHPFDRSASSKENGARLAKAIAALQPGDRLEVEGGEYAFEFYWNWKITGNEKAPIWVVAPGNDVVWTRSNDRQNVLNIGLEADSPLEYLVLQGLEIRGGSHGIRIGSCHNLVVDHCHIHHTADVCLSANSHDCSFLYLINNTIHDGGGTAEGMYLGGNHSHVRMSQSMIAGNHVFNCFGSQGDGIEVKQGSWGNTIRNNLVHDCHYPCIITYGTDDRPINRIENNLCYRSDDSVMQIQGDAFVANNLLMAGKNAAFASHDHQGKTKRLHVIHNTMINENHAFRGGSWNDRDDMLLANNVLYSQSGNAMLFPNGFARVQFAGNVAVGQGNIHGSKRGEGLSDFQDVAWDASHRNARPRSGSLFQSVAAEHLIPLDFFGKPRKANHASSGALEP